MIQPSTSWTVAHFRATDRRIRRSSQSGNTSSRCPLLAVGQSCMSSARTAFACCSTIASPSANSGVSPALIGTDPLCASRSRSGATTRSVNVAQEGAGTVLASFDDTKIRSRSPASFTGSEVGTRLKEKLSSSRKACRPCVRQAPPGMPRQDRRSPLLSAATVDFDEQFWLRGIAIQPHRAKAPVFLHLVNETALYLGQLHRFTSTPNANFWSPKIFQQTRGTGWSSRPPCVATI